MSFLSRLVHKLVDKVKTAWARVRRCVVIATYIAVLLHEECAVVLTVTGCVVCYRWTRAKMAAMCAESQAKLAIECAEDRAERAAIYARYRAISAARVQSASPGYRAEAAAIDAKAQTIYLLLETRTNTMIALIQSLIRSAFGRLLGQDPPHLDVRQSLLDRYIGHG